MFKYINIPNEADLRRLYTDEKWSTRKCAEYFEMSQPSLIKYMNEYSIERRVPKDYKSRLGLKSTDSHKSKISKALKGNKNAEGFPCSEEKKQKIRESNIESYKPHLKFKNTSIEVKMASMLDDLGVSYLQNHALDKIANVDFYIPSKKLVIECDGDYWHNLPGMQERDALKTSKLEAAGYKVVRFWEHEIHAMTLVMI